MVDPLRALDDARRDAMKTLLLLVRREFASTAHVQSNDSESLSDSSRSVSRGMAIVPASAAAAAWAAAMAALPLMSGG